MHTTSRSLTAAWPLVIFLLLPARARAEIAVLDWVQRLGGGGSQPAALAVDGGDNVIVTGFVPGLAGNFITVKYSSAGIPLWTNCYNGGIPEGMDFARALAVDADNSVVVAGYSQATFYGGPARCATVKYSSAGAPVWTNLYIGSVLGSSVPCAVAVDGSNNVIVTGSSDDSVSQYDYATIKYSSAGVPLWTNRYGSSGYDIAAAMTLDHSGNVIVAGWSAGIGTIKYSSDGIPLWTNRYNTPGGFGDAMAAAVDSSNNVIVTAYAMGLAGAYDYATIKYSSVGVPLWTNFYHGPGNGDDYARAVAIDASNNVIVTGCSVGSGTTNDYATIKYSSAGVPLWTNRYNGPADGDDCASAVAVDGSNNVIVTGYSVGNGTAEDYLTIKYSSAGEPLWTCRYNGPGNGSDCPVAVAVDRSRNVIATGSSAGRAGNPDFATIKYVFPLVITDCKLTGDAFQMRVDNVFQPGTLVIEASSNVAAWAPLFTNTTPTNVVFYSDPDAASASARFYRAFQFP